MSSILETLNRTILKIVYFLVVIWSYVPLKNVLSALGSPGWREPPDCMRASELCNQNSQCSSRYRIMRQCLSGGDKERSTMLASKECQGALEVLQDSPLYDCRCKRGMKKELQCLQNYWSIHMGLTEVATVMSAMMVDITALCCLASCSGREGENSHGVRLVLGYFLLVALWSVFIVECC
uniref:GDNF family receptor alpha 2b n=1 Tax=Xiphophorus couchianus TaxID=32473 RepID=A0A3B5MU26_9TELE